MALSTLTATRPRRLILGGAGGLCALFVLASLSLYLGQRRLIYAPTQLSQAQWQQALNDSPAPHPLVLAPFDALVFELPLGIPHRGTAIFFHGSAGDALDRRDMAPLFLRRGLRLILAEYPGYGPRVGSPSEEVLVADANALYVAVAQRYHDGPITLIGESLGSGVAVQVAARQFEHRPHRLVLLTPFMSLAETAARIYWYLPVRHLVQDVFDSAAHLVAYTGPVAILAAGQDQLLGPEQARTLAQVARARGEAIYLELPTAQHDRQTIHLSESDVNSLLGVSEVPTRRTHRTGGLPGAL